MSSAAMTSKMFLRLKWPKGGLYCPLGKIRTRPTVKVTLSSAFPVVPFMEIDRVLKDFAEGCREATHEAAALSLAGIISHEFKRRVTVRVGEPDLWAEVTMEAEVIR